MADEDMIRESDKKEQEKKDEGKKEQADNPFSRDNLIIDYDAFVNLEKRGGYFATESPFEMIALAPKIKDFFVQTLRTRPYEEDEFFELLEVKEPRLSMAYAYIMDQIDMDGENYESCRSALELISEGVDVRSKDGIIYLGLVSKLDSV